MMHTSTTRPSTATAFGLSGLASDDGDVAFLENPVVVCAGEAGEVTLVEKENETSSSVVLLLMSGTVGLIDCDLGEVKSTMPPLLVNSTRKHRSADSMAMAFGSIGMAAL